jgi:outer membrane protein assembly factor BamB
VGSVYDSNLYAFDGNDGSVKWVHHFDSNGWVFASPVLNEKDGIIYQTLVRDSNLYAIDVNDGNIIWMTNMMDTNSGIFELLYEKELETVNLGGVIYEQSGTISVYDASESSFSEPALSNDGTIYASYDDPYIRAVEPNGNIQWIKKFGVLGGFTMTVGNDGLIYAASDDGLVYIIDNDGEELARFEGDGWLSYPVITDNNSLLVSDSNNIVWAIDTEGCGGEILNPHRPQDINGDGIVNFLDFGFVAEHWLDCTDQFYYPHYEYWEEPWRCVYDYEQGAFYNWSFEQYEFFCSGDLNRDFYIDLEDLAILVNGWLMAQ